MIRLYKESDYEMVKGWWEAFSEPAPTPEMIPLQSTYIYEVRGVPALCVSLILTNISEYCLIDNFVRNPSFDDKNRRHAIKELFAKICNDAKDMGYSKVFCLSYRGKIKELYRDLGLTQTLDGVATFIKEVK